MDRRPESSRNGKSELNGNGKGSYPILETRRIPQSQPYSRRSPSLLPLVVMCLVVGLAAVLLVQSANRNKETETISKSEAFRWAVNRAMSAAELTQTARSASEWQQVVNWWQDAIKLMQSVPASDDKHEIAVDRTAEYQKNFQYAQRRLQEATQSITDDLWGIGSSRAMVIKVQGQPSSTDRYDSMCKEVLNYGKGFVELNNGVVVRYEDFDHKFKAAAPDITLPPIQDRSAWNLGSLKDDVFRIQGTPTRVVQYDYSERETLYYGNSTIDFAKQRVIGYDNQAGNLKVYVVPTVTNPSSNTWTLKSDREEIFLVQGTPTRVQVDPSACAETLYYGNSSITLKNGFITGYDNLDNNLRVQTAK